MPRTLPKLKRDQPETTTISITDKAEGNPVVPDGSINELNQLIDSNGNAIQVSDTSKSLEIKSLVNKKVRISGAMKEKDNKQIMEVEDYVVLE